MEIEIDGVTFSLSPSTTIEEIENLISSMTIEKEETNNNNIEEIIKELEEEINRDKEDIIKAINKFRKEKHNYYFSREIFWKELFNHLRENVL